MPAPAKSGDTFDVHWGVFLNEPSPLELSFNWCTHACRYCFANLNKPGRRADVKATMNMLAQYQDRHTLTAFLLREGYPTVISNRVDPFAVSNDRTAIPVMEVMTSLGLPIALQTRGGRSVDQALAFLPPTTWYVSITMLDETLAKSIEPGAPRIGERLDLVQKLAEAGHHVTVAINPLVAEWLPDPSPLIEACVSRGASGFWLEEIHLSDRQVSRLKPREITAIGPEVITRARKRLTQQYSAHLRDARETATELGVPVFTTGQSCRSDVFEPYETIYGGKVFPTIQGFINHCYDTLPDGGLVTLDEFLHYFVPRLPAGEWQVHHYVGASSKDVLRDHPMPSVASYEALLRMGWEDGRCKFNPARIDCFAYAGVPHPDGGWIGLTDDDGALLMVFDPTAGLTEYFTELEG